MSKDSSDSDISISEYKKQKRKDVVKKNYNFNTSINNINCFFYYCQWFYRQKFFKCIFVFINIWFSTINIYRIQIIKKLPENVANWFVDQTHEIEENSL